MRLDRVVMVNMYGCEPLIAIARTVWSHQGDIEDQTWLVVLNSPSLGHLIGAQISELNSSV